MTEHESRALSPALIVVTAIMVVLAAGFVLFGVPAGAEDTASDVSGEDVLAEATFYVAWYDVGKRALAGLDGVEEVKNGINNGREINRVTYNPNLITIEEMVNALKDANTYRGTVEDGG